MVPLQVKFISGMSRVERSLDRDTSPTILSLAGNPLLQLDVASVTALPPSKGHKISHIHGLKQQNNPMVENFTVQIINEWRVSYLID